MDTEKLISDLSKFSKLIQKMNPPIQIIFNKNADSIISAAILGRTFADLKIPCIISLYDSKNYIPFKREYQSILLNVQFQDLKEISNKSILIKLGDSKSELVNVKNLSVLEIIAEKYNLKRNELTLSDCIYLICNQFAPSLEYIVRLPLIAKQSISFMDEYFGISKLICNDALTGNIIKIEKSFAILGSEILSISEALLYSQQPFLPGLTGNELQVIKLLSKANIEQETNTGSRHFQDLDVDEIKNLNSNLIVQLALNKGYQEGELDFIKEKTIILDEEINSIFHNTWDFYASINDAINRKQFYIVLAVLIGNRSNYSKQLKRIYSEERKAIKNSFQLIYDHKDNIIELGNLRYYLADRKINWYNASITAAMSLASGLVSNDQPFAVVTPGPDTYNTIGIRINRNQKSEIKLNQVVTNILKQLNINIQLNIKEYSAQFSLDQKLTEKFLTLLNEKLDDFNK